MSLIWLFLSVAFAREISAVDYVKAPANPVDAEVVLEQTEVHQKIIAKDGGSLTLTMSTGDVVELVFPKKSLPYDALITLQEIKEIKSTKLGKIDYQSSVQIQPEGIELLEPAKLTFKLKKPIDVKKFTAFGSNASGENVSPALTVGTIKPEQVTLGLLHFSNYGVIAGLTVEEIISDGFSRITTQRVANWFARENARAAKTGDISHIGKAAQEMFTKVVRPAVNEAKSCSAMTLAMQHYTGWARSLQLLGLDPDDFTDPDFQTDVFQIQLDGLPLCFDELVKACYQDHMPVEVQAESIGYERMIQVSIGDDNRIGRALLEPFEELRDKCGNFRFFMVSDMWMGKSRQEGNGIVAKADFEFKLYLHYDEPIMGPIDTYDLDLRFPGASCELTNFGTEAANMVIAPALFRNDRSKPETVSMLITNLQPLTKGKFICSMGGGPPMEVPVPGDSLIPVWGGYWIMNHGPKGTNEEIPDTLMYILRDWEVRNDHRWMHKTYLQTIGDISENTEITIYHEPIEPAPVFPKVK